MTMKERKIDLLGVSETKWSGKGERELREGYKLFWSWKRRERNRVAFSRPHKTTTNFIHTAFTSKGEVNENKVEKILFENRRNINKLRENKKNG